MSETEQSFVTFAREDMVETEAIFEAHSAESAPEDFTMFSMPTDKPWEKIQGVSWIRHRYDEDNQVVFVQNGRFTEAYRPQPVAEETRRGMGRRIFGLAKRND